MCKLYYSNFKRSKSLCVAFLLSLSLLVGAQDDTPSSIVKVDSTWSTEIIPFPVDWLPKLTIKGFEELRFAPNWSDPKHQEFWTLVMAWQLETETILPMKELQFNLNHYFTELMKPNHWATEFPDPILQLQDLEATKSGINFKGRLTFFDGFHTGKVISVNILGNQTLCDAANTSVIVFRISPQDYREAIWKELNAVVVNDKDCLD